MAMGAAPKTEAIPKAQTATSFIFKAQRTDKSGANQNGADHHVMWFFLFINLCISSPSSS
jgi:hypothetical protein